MLEFPDHCFESVNHDHTSPRKSIDQYLLRALVQGVSRRPATTISTSRPTARATVSTVPTVTGVRKKLDSPSYISRPRPPCPSTAVTVTRPTVVTVARRRPARIEGMARGS